MFAAAFQYIKKWLQISFSLFSAIFYDQKIDLQTGKCRFADCFFIKINYPQIDICIFTDGLGEEKSIFMV